MAFNTVSICWPSALVVVGNRLQNLGQILGLESLKFGSNLLDLMIVKDFEEGVLYLRCTTYLDSSVREDDVFNKGWLRRSSHEISGGRVDHTIDSLRSKRYHVVPYEELNGIPVALVARFGVVSMCMGYGFSVYHGG
ncbi:hypothetical protein Tco_1067678 [Tanacetum coccineum]|uniref:Uncharacterized protein n=1 Tax=Tanacetum coccineum TaxID=301880 RepID=A0ABQ5EYY9_9ASTR